MGFQSLYNKEVFMPTKRPNFQKINKVFCTFFAFWENPAKRCAQPTTRL